MIAQTAAMSAEEFERFALLPENRERLLQLVAGQINEVEAAWWSSVIAARIGSFVGGYVRQHKLGFTTGADGGYCIGADRYLPKAAFVSEARQAMPGDEYYNSVPPDLAVEVLSPSNTPDEIAVKVDNYLRAGVVIWVVNPDAQRVTVHRPDATPRTYGISDTLDGGGVLPGFTLAVKDIFAE